MTESVLNQRQLYNQMTKVQHKVFGPMVSGFLNAIEEDPYFAGRALVYLYQHSQVRDQKDCAVIALLQSPPEYGLRDVGSALFALDYAKVRNANGFDSIPPFRLFRIWDYISGREMAVVDDKIKRIDRVTPGPKVHSRMKNLMIKYVDFLQSNTSRFDGVVELNRQLLKNVCTTYGVRLSERSDSILFKDNPPDDSKPGVIKRIVKMVEEGDVVDAAILGIENKLSYVVMQSIIPKREPAVSIALIEAMTPQQAANSIGWVEKTGLLNIPEVKDAFTAKVKKAKNLTSLQHRKSSTAKTEAVKEAISEAKEQTIKELPKIERDTLVMIDVSSSMERSISVATNLLTNLAPYLEPSISRIVWFKDYAGIMELSDYQHKTLVNSFFTLRANGGTSMVAGLQAGVSGGFEPENIVVITDGGEDAHLGLRNSFRMSKVVRDMEPQPQVIIIGVGNYQSAFTQSFVEKGIPVDEFHFDNSDEYYVYDQVGALLAGARKKTLVETIAQIELPKIVNFIKV